MSFAENNLVDTAKVHIRKCATALAFAVIKLKSNVTTHEFCEIIKEQLNLENINNSCSFEQSQRDALQTLSQNNYLFSTTQPISQETFEILNQFKQVLHDTDESVDKRSMISRDFEVLLAVENVKKLIKLITGTNAFDDNCIPDQTSLTNTSQDSGYRSSQNCTGNYKQKTSDTASLNRSLLVLVAYLNNVSTKTLNKDIVSLVSKVFGTGLDQLFQKNIYLSFYDTVVDALDDIFEKLQKKDAEDIENLLFKINVFNNSYVLINHSLTRLTNDLQSSMTKISLCGPTDAIEIADPNTTDYIFYVFHLLEILLKRKLYLKSKLFKSNSGESKMTENYELIAGEDKLQSNDYGKLLSKIILECSETYPLIAFWAMECYNINVENK